MNTSGSYSFSKAFDKVLHHGLLYKMHVVGIKWGILHLTRSFLYHRSYPTYDPPSGMWVQVYCRVRSSRLLRFNIYFNDILTIPYVNLAKYANDVCIFTTSRNPRVTIGRLQESLVRSILPSIQKKLRRYLTPEVADEKGGTANLSK